MLGIIGSVGSSGNNGEKFVLTLTKNSDNKMKIFIDVDTQHIESISDLRNYIIQKGYINHFDGDSVNETNKVLPVKTIPVYYSGAGGYTVPYALFLTQTQSGWEADIRVVFSPATSTRYYSIYILAESWTLAYE